MKTIHRQIVAALLSLGLAAEPALAASAESSVWNDRRRAGPRAAVEAPRFAALARPLPVSDRSMKVLREMPRLGSALATPPDWRRASTGLPDSLQSLVDALPLTAFTVVDVRAGEPGRPTVLLIQDIHLNAEAQNAIADGLAPLFESKAVSRVGLEGAFGPVDIASFRAFPDRDGARDVARRFMKENLLSAPSYAAIAAKNDPPVLVGVDDEPAYRANVAAYLSARETAARLSAAVGALKGAQAEAKRRFLSRPLLELESLKEGYASGALGLSVHAKRLAALGAPIGPGLRRFLEASAMESAIDFAAVERERRSVIEKLARSLSEDETAELLRQSLAYRAGRLGFGDYYAGLKRLCERRGVSLSATPAFDGYVRYVILADGIRAERLIADVAAAESGLAARLTTNDDQRRVLATGAHLRLIEKLAAFGLTPEEWTAYASVRRPIAALAAELSALAGRAVAVEDVPLAAFESFYAQADRRTEAMADALVKGVSGGAVALVVGGFHTRHFKDLFAERGYGSVVVSPKISRVDLGGATAYLNVFAREKTPLDRLFAGEKLSINPERVHPSYPPTGLALKGQTALAADAGAVFPPATGATRAGRVIEVDAARGLAVGRGGTVLGWARLEALPFGGWVYRRLSMASLFAGARRAPAFALVLPLWNALLAPLVGRERAARVASRLWFRSGVVPVLELFLLPGLAFALAPAVGAAGGVVLAAALFALLHGAPARSGDGGFRQSGAAFAVRFGAALVIMAAVVQPDLGIALMNGAPAWMASAAAAMKSQPFLYAMIGHALWNAAAPAAYRLMMSDRTGEEESERTGTGDERQNPDQRRAEAEVLFGMAEQMPDTPTPVSARERAYFVDRPQTDEWRMGLFYRGPQVTLGWSEYEHAVLIRADDPARPAAAFAMSARKAPVVMGLVRGADGVPWILMSKGSELYDADRQEAMRSLEGLVGALVADGYTDIRLQVSVDAELTALPRSRAQIHDRLVREAERKLDDMKRGKEIGAEHAVRFSARVTTRKSAVADLLVTSDDAAARDASALEAPVEPLEAWNDVQGPATYASDAPLPEVKRFVRLKAPAQPSGRPAAVFSSREQVAEVERALSSASTAERDEAMATLVSLAQDKSKRALIDNAVVPTLLRLFFDGTLHHLSGTTYEAVVFMRLRIEAADAREKMRLLSMFFQVIEDHVQPDGDRAVSAMSLIENLINNTSLLVGPSLYPRFMRAQREIVERILALKRQSLPPFFAGRLPSLQQKAETVNALLAEAELIAGLSVVNGRFEVVDISPAAPAPRKGGRGAFHQPQYYAKARAEIDRYVTDYELHDGAFHVLDALDDRKELPADAIIVNVDPHHDLYRGAGLAAPNTINAANWIETSLKDQVKGYLQVIIDENGLYTFRLFRRGSSTPQTLSKDAVAGLLSAHPIFLTIDADAFSLAPFKVTQAEVPARSDMGHVGYQVGSDDSDASRAALQKRIAPLGDMFKAANRRPIRVVLAESPEYIAVGPSSLWYEMFKEEMGKFADGLAGGQVLPGAPGSAQMTFPFWRSLLVRAFGEARGDAIASSAWFRGAVVPVLEFAALPGFTLLIAPWAGLPAGILLGAVLFALLHGRPVNAASATEGFRQSWGQFAVRLVVSLALLGVVFEPQILGAVLTALAGDAGSSVGRLVAEHPLATVLLGHGLWNLVTPAPKAARDAVERRAAAAVLDAVARAKGDARAAAAGMVVALRETTPVRIDFEAGGTGAEAPLDVDAFARALGEGMAVAVRRGELSGAQARSLAPVFAAALALAGRSDPADAFVAVDALSTAAEGDRPTDLFEWLPSSADGALRAARQSMDRWRAAERGDGRLTLVAPQGAAALRARLVEAYGADALARVDVVDAASLGSVMDLLKRGNADAATDAALIERLSARRSRFLVRNDAAPPAGFFDLNASGLPAALRAELQRSLEIYLIVDAIARAVRIDESALPSFERYRLIMIQA